SRINAYRGLRRTLVAFRPSLSQPRMIIAHVSRCCKCFLGDFLNFFEKILRFAERRSALSPKEHPCRIFAIRQNSSPLFAESTTLSVSAFFCKSTGSTHRFV
ncbi:MAG TPA: hypothetical protein K8V20_07100, partial [Subdoligranulum variabile]|nr:hypothetical protein [Subdoligranulum variabile]